MAGNDEMAARVGPGGRIVIPARFRRALGLKPGEAVVLHLEHGQLHLYSRRQARRQAQERVCKAIPPETSLVEELIRERRQEASRE